MGSVWALIGALLMGGIVIRLLDNDKVDPNG